MTNVMKVPLVGRDRDQCRRGDLSLPAHGQISARAKTRHRFQPLPIRRRGRVEMGRLGGRQLLAHHRRHHRHLAQHERQSVSIKTRPRLTPSPATGTTRTCSIVGQVGWGHLHPTRLTPDEQYTHISLWCLLSAPLLIGCDMTKLDDFTLNLLENDEVLALDQDALGKEATCVVTNGDVRVYEKELEDGGRALGFFNLGSAPASLEFNQLAPLGFTRRATRPRSMAAAGFAGRGCRHRRLENDHSRPRRGALQADGAEMNCEKSKCVTSFV